MRDLHQINHFGIPNYISAHCAHIGRRHLLTIKLVTVATQPRGDIGGQLICRLQIFQHFSDFPIFKPENGAFSAFFTFFAGKHNSIYTFELPKWTFWTKVAQEAHFATGWVSQWAGQPVNELASQPVN